MKSALLLVDLQHDFLSEPGLEPHRAAIVAGAIRLRRECQDRGIPICHVWTTVRRDPDNRMPHWKQSDRWSCLEGALGHAVPQGLEPADGETLFHKSGFSAATDPAFLEFIDRHSHLVIIAGVHTHACIRQAALDAFQRGAQVWIAADAIGSHEPLHAAQSELYLRRRTIPFLSTDEILARLDNRDFGVHSSTPEIPSITLGDETQKGESPRIHTHFSPSLSNTPLWRCASPSQNQIDVLIHAAKASLANLPDIHDRIQSLEKAAGLLLARPEPFVSRLVTEIGKPIRQARDEICRCADLFQAVARRAASQPLFETEPEAGVARRPHGLVALVTPWNNPLGIFAGQFAPAFAYGNASIWKPALPALPLALDLRALLIEAGVPAAALQIIGGDEETGINLLSHAGIDAVCFTGSTRNGWKAAQLCAAGRKPLQAELGGNNAAILWPDAPNLESITRGIVEAAFGFSGQRCTATRRVILHDVYFDESLALLQKALAAIAWGDPSVESTEAGPLISSASVSRVSAVVERAREADCQIFQPHLISQPDLVARGAYYPPTLVICGDAAAEIVQAETFGPILVIQRARDIDHALELLNGVRQGLCASLFSTDLHFQERFLREAKAGILKINRASAGAGVDVPFGGWKDSGIGIPQHGKSNLEFFTRLQTIYREETSQ